MVYWRRPSCEAIREFLAEQSGLGFTYSAVGATATTPPAGYLVDHTRFKLGRGREVYARAKHAMMRWEQFRLGWVEAWPSETPIRPGNTAAVIASLFGIWWLNACRIIYVVDEDGPISRFGFAYGTLPDHAAIGEERFLVEWDETTGEVWYDILAFSRTGRLLTKLGHWYMRKLQKRFRRESVAAMTRAVQDGESISCVVADPG